MVVDPMSNYIGHKDMMNEQKIRQVMMPIALMAQEFNIVTLRIFHNGKTLAGTQWRKVIGAVGNVGVCRIGWTFMKDPLNE